MPLVVPDGVKTAVQSKLKVHQAMRYSPAGHKHHPTDLRFCFQLKADKQADKTAVAVRTKTLHTNLHTRNFCMQPPNPAVTWQPHKQPPHAQLPTDHTACYHQGFHHIQNPGMQWPQNPRLHVQLQLTQTPYHNLYPAAGRSASMRPHCYCC